MKRPNWRLKKTLARRVEFRPIENDDVRYAWAAYKKGGLAPMGEIFAGDQLTAAEFKAAFETEIMTKYDGAWTLFAETAKGFIPVGFVLGIWGPMQAFMTFGGVAWFPWATRRNIIESMVNFLSKIRHEIPMMGYAMPDHKRLYEVACIHGVMRRIGTSYTVFRGQPAAVFETRT